MNRYRITYRMEVFVDAETSVRANEIFNNTKDLMELSPGFVELGEIELSEENVDMTTNHGRSEVPAKNLEKYDFNEFIVRYNSEVIFSTNNYNQAMIKYEEVRKYYGNPHQSSLDGRNEDGLTTIHYIHDNEIKDYSYFIV